MTLEKINEFIQEDLRYKSHIKVISYEILPGGYNNRNWIDLKFNNGKGELVSASRYYDWLEKERSEKLNKIL